MLDLCEFRGGKDDEVSFILELTYIDDWKLMGIFLTLEISGGEEYVLLNNSHLLKCW